MNTVQNLQESGFQVSTAKDAIGCTELLSDSKFYCYNPKFLEMISEIEQHVFPSQSSNGKERIIVAGIFERTDVFPFVVISENEYESLREMVQDWRNAQAKIKAAQKELDIVQNDFRNFLRSFDEVY